MYTNIFIEYFSCTMINVLLVFPILESIGISIKFEQSVKKGKNSVLSLFLKTLKFQSFFIVLYH